MRHNKWNKYLKIACSWILIFSMCFLSLNTVNASAEDTNAFESESEETKQETEKQIPDSIEVAQLNAEIQNRVANGEVPSTDRVKYVDEDGNPNLVTDEHAEVIDYIRSMINDGVCEIAPGGGFHTEEWYGHLNGGGVASVIMPLWYMGRFTDYCSDLDGKMAIYPIPVWNEGDTREVLQGGTGTSVIKGTENEQLAKDFLAFAKLSKEGCTYEWEKLGFDPIRTELWDDPAITENKDNKFLAYFTTNPFDILKENGTDITAPNISGSYSATYSTLVSTTYSNAFEISVDQDAKELLQSEQDSIIY